MNYEICDAHRSSKLAYKCELSCTDQAKRHQCGFSTRQIGTNAGVARSSLRVEPQLTLEVLAKRSLGDAGSFDDFICGRELSALPVKQICCGADDLEPCIRRTVHF